MIHEQSLKDPERLSDAPARCRESAALRQWTFEEARPQLRLRIVAERLVRQDPEAYVTRKLADGIHVSLAIDGSEHVIYVSPQDLQSWTKTADELFEIAKRQTETEPNLAREEIVLPSGQAITLLSGESDFATSHAFFWNAI